MKKIEETMKWAENELRNCHYGDIQITFIVHNGKVARVEKGTIHKVLAEEEYNSHREMALESSLRHPTPTSNAYFNKKHSSPLRANSTREG